MEKKNTIIIAQSLRRGGGGCCRFDFRADFVGDGRNQERLGLRMEVVHERFQPFDQQLAVLAGVLRVLPERAGQPGGQSGHAGSQVAHQRHPTGHVVHRVYAGRNRLAGDGSRQHGPVVRAEQGAHHGQRGVTYGFQHHSGAHTYVRYGLVH